jgi:hypothetical protein
MIASSDMNMIVIFNNIAYRADYITLFPPAFYHQQFDRRKMFANIAALLGPPILPITRFKQEAR